jgi:hypothetical protein
VVAVVRVNHAVRGYVSPYGLVQYSKLTVRDECRASILCSQTVIQGIIASYMQLLERTSEEKHLPDFIDT